MNRIFSFSLIVLILFVISSCKKADPKNKPQWAQKDIRDFSDADMERLLEQWEEDDEPLEEDELPEYLRKPPKIDLSEIGSKDPENILKLSKKGQTVMTFVSVSGNPTRDEAETVTKLWQTGLWNNHIQVERYMVDDNRAIFLYKDGSQAWEGKDFLIEQERCESVTIENKVYEGKNLGNKESGKKEEL